MKKLKRLLILLLVITYLNAEDFRIGYDGTTTSRYSKKEMTIASEVWIKALMKDINYICYINTHPKSFCS